MQSRIQHPLSGTASIRFVRDTIAPARKQGYDCNRLLRVSRIDPALLTDDQAFVPVERALKLLVSTICMMDDEFVGYGDDAVKVGTWQIACLSAVHPGSIGHAIDRMCQFYRIINVGAQLRSGLKDGEASIEIVQSSHATLWHLYLYQEMLTTLRAFLVWLLRDALPLRAVSLPHARPEHVTELQWIFQPAKVLFGQEHAGLLFDRTVLDAPIRRDEQELERFLAAPHRVLFAVSGLDGTWASRIRQLITPQLPHLPELVDVAAHLGIHPQALRRRLAHEGLSFNVIKDQVRGKSAQYHLSKEELSIEEVAFRSGFSEASSFIRAFRRWTGMTPASYARSRRPRLSTLV